MYSKEKIMKIMHQIKDESAGIKPYVVIAQPLRSEDTKPAQNLNGAEGLHIDLCGFSHGYCNIMGESVDVARNYLIEQVLESDAKYMFFVGEDTVIPWDGFQKLHAVAEKNPDAMVVGVYYIKLSIPMIMMYKDGFITPADVTPGQIIHNAWQTGMDAALIPVSLLRKMKEADPEIPFCCIARDIEGLPFVGEDNFFEHRWHKMGFDIIVNTDVQCLHMDLATGKYTAYPEIDLNNYFTQIPITERLTMADKKHIDLRWIGTLPKPKNRDVDKCKKLNLGCGGQYLEDYINIDLYSQADIKMDIRELDFKDNIIEEILLLHVLEHFNIPDVNIILQHCERVLQPGGKIIIEVPDLEYCLKNWINTPEDDSKKWEFNLQTIYGDQHNDGEYHKTGFTESRIKYMVEEVGFTNIETKKIESHLQECVSLTAYKKEL